jgi:mannose-6-phosphate isomerase-like protein (cupin superfamily)
MTSKERVLARVPVVVVDVLREAEKIPFPHGSVLLVEADGFMIHAWLGNEKMANWHRNVDVDELWIHYKGPPITVDTQQLGPATVVLHEGQLALLPRWAVHTSDAPAEPRATVVIVERSIPDYPRWPVADAERLSAAPLEVKLIDLNEEIRNFTPPWRYPQTELVRADGFTIQLHVRSEGSLVRRYTPPSDEVWFVLKGQVQLETEGEGKGPTVGEGEMAKVPAGILYRPVALTAWTAALLIRR